MNEADSDHVEEARQQLGWLLAACAKGDRAAFRRLYELTSRQVFGITSAVLRDRGLAEEVAQEVYLSIWRQASRFDGKRGSAFSWVASIARNRAIDRLRAERARGFVEYTDTLPELALHPENGLGSVEALALRTALDGLRAEYRRAVLLNYFQGYSHSELAKVLGVPVGTAKSWVSRGLTALREALA